MTEKRGFEPRGVAWFDGSFVPVEEARVSIATHAFNYGTGCFEGIRGYWNAGHREIYLLRLREHFERLLRSTRMLRIDIRMGLDELCEMAVELVRRGEFFEDVYVRPVAYKSSPVVRVGLLGLEDGFCCFTAAMGAYFDIERGLSVTVSSWRRNDDSAIPSRAKATGGYINAALAIADAEEAGYDDAIMLTSDGHVSEASASNLFLVIRGRLVTPAVTEDILEGITRDAVIAIAGRLGLSVEERRIDRTELYVSDEMFLCGTGVQVTPVTSVDGRPVGSGAMGEITKTVQQRYLAAVRGDDHEFRSWLTPVYGRGGGSEADEPPPLTGGP